MDPLQNNYNNSDDAWIQKYRTALSSAPVQHSKIERIREIASHAGTFLVRYVVHNFAKNHATAPVEVSASLPSSLPPRRTARPFSHGRGPIYAVRSTRGLVQTG